MKQMTFECKEPNDVAQILLGVYSQARNGEKIRATAGEFAVAVYDLIASDIINIVQEKKLDVNYLTGPIINVKDGCNKFFDRVLAENIMKVYISPTRQLRHFIICSDRYAVVQEPHSPSPSIRKGYWLNSKYSLHNIHIRGLMRHFDNCISCYNLKPISQQSNEYVRLTSSEIADLDTRLKDGSPSYNFLTVDHVRQYFRAA